MATWEGKPTLASVLKDYIPPTESALADPIKEHFRTLPQQLATNQAAMDSAIGSWNKTDFGTGLPNPNYRPEAIQELTQLMPNMAGMIAYHGTPHNIQGKFDINKVGTGEGNQSYGHGMYFAENPEVAEGYKNILSKDSQNLAKWALDWKEKNPELAKEFIAELKQKSNNKGTSIADFAYSLKNSKYANNIPSETAGLYKVNIPDKDIPNMMDYYKPLSEQPQAVRDIAMQYANGLKNKLGFKGVKSIWELDGGDLYGVMQRYQFNDAGKLVKKNVDAKDVSDKLLNAGIPGIRYLDQGSLQQTDSYLAKHGGTSNFVVFEPSTVKILEKNGKPLTRKELIEKELKKVVE